MKSPRLSLVALVALMLTPILLPAAWDYPAAKPTDHTDDYFGTKVADPFRWMEDVDATATKTWVEAENKVTFDFLAKIPQREAIKQRLTELLNFPRFSLPAKEGGKYFYTMNTGLQNQAPLFVKDTLAAEGRLLLDPNTLAKDGTVALTGYVASKTASGWSMAWPRPAPTGTNFACAMSPPARTPPMWSSG